MVTGNDVYEGRIQDKFKPIIRQKVADLGRKILEVAFLSDEDQQIADCGIRLCDVGANMLITTSGMPDDPDNRTRFALKKVGACDMVYGSTVLPGRGLWGPI